MAEEVKLLKTETSPFGLRVTTALRIKGIEYETIIEDISNKSPLLLQSNSVHKKIPVLLHNGKSICESLVILEYIDETWKQNPLLPNDPYDKAMARFWAKFADDKLLSSIWKVFLTQEKEQEEAKTGALENLELIEELLKNKKFFHGETIGYLDIALCWMPVLLENLQEISGVKLIDGERFPFLSAWMDNLLNAPDLEGSWPPQEKLIAKYRSVRDKYIPPADAK